MSRTGLAAVLPAEFRAPDELIGERFRLRMLAASDAQADYEAVMESQARLRAHAPNGWPREGFTLEENRQDLIRHQAEFERGEAYAYTVVDPADTRVLGCVYINPSSNPSGNTLKDAPGTSSKGAEADVYLWARDSEHEAGLTPALHAAVRRWLEEDWPFEHINWVRPAYYRTGTELELYAVRIFTRQWQAAVAFYGDTMGLRQSFADERLGWAEFDIGNTRIAVERLDEGDPEAENLVGRFVGVSLATTDITAAWRRLTNAGVRFETPPERQPWGGVLAHFQDPDGNVLTLLEK